MNDLYIKELEHREDIIKFWEPMAKSNIPKLYGMDSLCESIGLVLLNQAKVFVAVENNLDVGCMIFQLKGDTAIIRQFYSPNLSFKFRDMVIDKLKTMGIKRIGGITSHNNHAAFERLLGAKQIYAYYEREV